VFFFLNVLVARAVIWTDLQDDICANPYISGVPPDMCITSCDVCVQSGSTKLNNRVWCPSGTITLVPDPSILLYSFPTNQITVNGMCWPGDVFAINSNSGSFQFQNYTVQYTVECDAQYGIPMLMQCDVQGYLLVVAPLIVFIMLLLCLCVCFICCCVVTDRCDIFHIFHEADEKPKPKKKAAEPVRKKADAPVLSYMKNNVELDTFSEKNKTDNPDNQPLVYTSNVPTTEEPVQEEEEDSEVVGAGGQVNLGALGFQEEYF